MPAVASAELTSPQRMSKAISLVEDEERNESLMQAIDLFERDRKAPIVYLALKKKEARRAWLHRRLAQEAENTALMNNFTMFPPT